MEKTRNLYKYCQALYDTTEDSGESSGGPRLPDVESGTKVAISAP
jgi:hypothetical protein